jgi:fructose-1,6-bisphosphatase I
LGEGYNIQGEDQQKLDVMANTTFIQIAKRECSFRHCFEERRMISSASQKRDENHQNKYIAVDRPT